MDDDRFFARKMDASLPYCTRCPLDSKTPAIAWVTIPKKGLTFLGKPVTSVTIPLCRACGLEVQREAAADGSHVDVQEIK